MKLLIARGRRRDRHGQVTIELNDLSTSTARALVFSVAASLRERLPVSLPSAAAEQQLNQASALLLAAHDPSRSLDALTASLVAAFAEEQRIDLDLVEMVIRAGDVGLLGHLLGFRAQLHHRTVFDEIISCQSRRVMMVLRAAGLPRQMAALFLATLGDLVGLKQDAHALEAFDHWSEEQLNAARTWLSLDPVFQSALRDLGHGNGHRPV